MTDLTGVELALAVARVMRRPISTVQPIANGGAIAGFVDPRVVDAAHCTWRPDRGGAAAWEVLEWVISRGSVEFMRDGDECQCVWYPDDIGIVERTPTDAIALCRAVVALGEAG